MASEVTASTRVPWSPSALVPPLVLLGAIGLLVHVARPASGKMFDDSNVGGTVVLGVVGVVAVVIGIVMTRAMLRGVALRGPCPICGAVADRKFASAVDPKTLPSACGTCIAYLRPNARNEVREETDTQVQNLPVKFPYALSADQYMPAVQRTSRNYFKFEMPTMCATCGDPNAPHKRDINDGDHFGDDIFDAANAGHAPGQIGAAASASTDDDKHSRGLSHLKAPVCDKHTEEADTFGDVMRYSSGKLEFASYRYYKAFCELNNITRASARKRS